MGKIKKHESATQTSNPQKEKLKKYIPVNIIKEVVDLAREQKEEELKKYLSNKDNGSEICTEAGIYVTENAISFTENFENIINLLIRHGADKSKIDEAYFRDPTSDILWTKKLVEDRSRTKFQNDKNKTPYSRPVNSKMPASYFGLELVLDEISDDHIKIIVTHALNNEKDLLKSYLEENKIKIEQAESYNGRKDIYMTAGNYIAKKAHILPNHESAINLLRELGEELYNIKRDYELGNSYYREIFLESLDLDLDKEINPYSKKYKLNKNSPRGI